MSAPKRAPDDGDEHGGDGLERTVAVWRPGMSRGTYWRLLRLLFDPPPGGGGSAAEPDSGRAA